MAQNRSTPKAIVHAKCAKMAQNRSKLKSIVHAKCAKNGSKSMETKGYSVYRLTYENVNVKYRPR